ncbi:MAG: serine/threonine-protein phosphatase [Candidatus Eremiobacteraeota bacterium]|nr:serine/threonine-protein phosphatase [Candidatus Eremiobacteraeota bacterium]
MRLLLDREAIVAAAIRTSAADYPNLTHFLNREIVRELFLCLLTHLETIYNSEVTLRENEPSFNEVSRCGELALALGRQAAASKIELAELIKAFYLFRRLFWLELEEFEFDLSSLQIKRLIHLNTRVNEYLADINFLIMQEYLKREREIVAAHEKRINADLELARQIQQSMFPSACQIGACGLCAEIIPSGAVGGDFYGMIPYGNPPTRADLFIGDVQGKGVAAALIMMLITSTIKGVAAENKTPKQIVSEVNLQFRRQMTYELNHFISLFYLSYNVSSKRLTYTKAGHEDGLLIRHKDNELVPLSTSGYFLGIFDDAEYEEKTITVNPGDRLYLFTDGVNLLGGADGKVFEYEDLYQIILKHNSLPIGDTLEQITRDLMNLYGDKEDLKDDVGLIVVQY